MRVLFHVHKYPPEHNAGAEWTAHHLILWLRAQGVDCRVLGSQIGSDFTFEKVDVRSGRSARAVSEAYHWAEVVVTHLDATTVATTRASRMRLPLVHLIHNHRQLRFHGVRPSRSVAAVFNSDWVAEASGWTGQSVVCHPYVPTARYRPIEGPHDSVTLFNLFASKGAAVFYAVAGLVPELHFLGVRGAYGRQVAPPILPNLTVVDAEKDVRRLLARTGLVMMPSTYESWGRIAQEAAAMGLPTLASMMPGPAEQRLAAGFLLPNAGAVEWAGAVRHHWGRREGEGKTAQARARELQKVTEGQLEEVLDLLLSLAAR